MVLLAGERQNLKSPPQWWASGGGASPLKFELRVGISG